MEAFTPLPASSPSFAGYIASVITSKARFDSQWTHIAHLQGDYILSSKAETRLAGHMRSEPSSKPGHWPHANFHLSFAGHPAYSRSSSGRKMALRQEQDREACPA